MTDDTKQPRRLPADVARCEGYMAGGKLRDECKDCLRRTDRSHDGMSWWLVPPKLSDSRCELRLDP